MSKGIKASFSEWIDTEPDMDYCDRVKRTPNGSIVAVCCHATCYPYTLNEGTEHTVEFDNCRVRWDRDPFALADICPHATEYIEEFLDWQRDKLWGGK